MRVFVEKGGIAMRDRALALLKCRSDGISSPGALPIALLKTSWNDMDWKLDENFDLFNDKNKNMGNLLYMAKQPILQYIIAAVQQNA